MRCAWQWSSIRGCRHTAFNQRRHCSKYHLDAAGSLEQWAQSRSSITAWAICTRSRRRWSMSRQAISVLVTTDPSEWRRPIGSSFPARGRCRDCMREIEARGLARGAYRGDAAKAVSWAFASACRCCSIFAKKAKLRVLACCPGKVVRFPVTGMVDEARAQAQSPAYGMESSAQTRSHPLWSGISDACALLFRAQLTMPSREIATVVCGTTCYPSNSLAPSPATTFCRRVSSGEKPSGGTKLLQFHCLESLNQCCCIQQPRARVSPSA